MMNLLTVAAAATALTVGVSTADARTCMIKDQIPVPCGGNAYAPPVYGAPVYRAPVYSNYYYNDDYYGYGPYDNYYYGGGYPFYGPSVSFGFGFDGGHHYGNRHRWYGNGHRWRDHRH